MYMARLTIYKDSNINTTAVSNRFIDEYMEGANEAQLKVYLYLLRMLGANQATSVSDLADQFIHIFHIFHIFLAFFPTSGFRKFDYFFF